MTFSATEIAQAVIRAWNSHDSDAVAALHADDFVGTDVASRAPTRGPAGVRRHFVHYLAAFPDLELIVDDLVVAGERVVIVWRTRGTHSGYLMNIPPSGRPVRVSGVSILTVVDGRIHRSQRIWDVAGFLRNVGLLPDLAPVEVEAREGGLPCRT